MEEAGLLGDKVSQETSTEKLREMIMSCVLPCFQPVPCVPIPRVLRHTPILSSQPPSYNTVLVR